MLSGVHEAAALAFEKAVGGIVAAAGFKGESSDSEQVREVLEHTFEVFFALADLGVLRILPRLTVEAAVALWLAAAVTVMRIKNFEITHRPAQGVLKRVLRRILREALAKPRSRLIFAALRKLASGKLSGSLLKTELSVDFSPMLFLTLARTILEKCVRILAPSERGPLAGQAQELISALAALEVAALLIKSSVTEDNRLMLLESRADGSIRAGFVRLEVLLDKMDAAFMRRLTRLTAEGNPVASPHARRDAHSGAQFGDHFDACRSSHRSSQRCSPCADVNAPLFENKEKALGMDNTTEVRKADRNFMNDANKASLLESVNKDNGEQSDARDGLVAHVNKRAVKHSRTETLARVLLASNLFTARVELTDPSSVASGRTLAVTPALMFDSYSLMVLLALKRRVNPDFDPNSITYEALSRTHESQGVRAECPETNTARQPLVFFASRLELPPLPAPVRAMFAEALSHIEEAIVKNPSLAGFYLLFVENPVSMRMASEATPKSHSESDGLIPRRSTMRAASNTTSSPCAVFIPEELLTIPPVFWLNALTAADLIVAGPESDTSKDIASNARRIHRDPVRGAATAGYVLRLMPESGATKESKTTAQSPCALIGESLSHSLSRSDSRKVCPSSSSSLADALPEASHGEVGDPHASGLTEILTVREAQGREAKLSELTALERRADAFLNEASIKELLRHYDKAFMAHAENLTLADVIKRHPAVHMKLAMMNYHRQKRERKLEIERNTALDATRNAT